MKITTNVDVDLCNRPTATVRTWLLLVNLVAGHGSPLMSTISDLTDAARSTGYPMSRASVSKGIKDLEAMGVISCERTGYAMQIRLVDSEQQAA